MIASSRHYSRRPRELRLPGFQSELRATHWLPHDGIGSYDNLIVFFHGGGFIADDSDQLTALFLRLSTGLHSTALLAPRYTLATSSPFPAALEDAYSALDWAVKNSKQLGWSGERLIVGGIEAGANLAASVAFVCRDRKQPQLAGQLLIMPMLDPSMTTSSMRCAHNEPLQLFDARRCENGYRRYLPDVVDRLHPYASPLNARRLKGLPPALILSAEADPLRDEAETYAESLRGAEVLVAALRLPALALAADHARGDCAASTLAAAAIETFLNTIVFRGRHPAPRAKSSP